MLSSRWFRDRTTVDALACDHGISRAREQGFSHMVLDGKIIPGDRCKASAVNDMHHCYRHRQVSENGYGYCPRGHGKSLGPTSVGSQGLVTTLV